MDYIIYGLRLHEVALTDLPHEDECNLNSPCVLVRIETPDSTLNSSKEGSVFSSDSKKMLLKWENIGSFLLHAGQNITATPAQNVADTLLRSVLLGPVMAMLLVQRGYLVLHASAVAIQNQQGTQRAVGFLGHSTQGKSTMATAMFKRGHRPLADDTMAVPCSRTLPSTLNRAWSDERPLIYPSLPHFKLRIPSLKALGESLDSLHLWRSDEDSYVLPLTHEFSQDPAPLQCLYVLQEGDTIQIQKLNPEEALNSLLDYSYCARALPDEQLGQDFLRCAELVQRVPIFRLQRPKDFGRLSDVVRAVEEHQASLDTNLL